MSFIYTPTPTPLDTITLPQDVVNKVMVNTVNPPFSDLADGVAFNTLAKVARFTITPGTYVANDAVSLVISSQYPSVGWSLDGLTRIVVPFDGVYRVDVQCAGVRLSGYSGTTADVRFNIGYESPGLNFKGSAGATRFSSDTSSLTTIVGSTVLAVADSASDRIRVINRSQAGTEPATITDYTTLQDDYSAVIVTYLGPIP